MHTHSSIQSSGLPFNLNTHSFLVMGPRLPHNARRAESDRVHRCRHHAGVEEAVWLVAEIASPLEGQPESKSAQKRPRREKTTAPGIPSVRVRVCTRVSIRCAIGVPCIRLCFVRPSAHQVTRRRGRVSSGRQSSDQSGNTRPLTVSICKFTTK